MGVRRGRFITFEGGEGTGKSTQAARLAERLRGVVGEVVLTREPGGSPGAEGLRSLLLQGEAMRWSPTSEALLMYAARADHLERLIRPALAAGRWVVSDRFHDSTAAYQGAGGGAPSDLIDQLDALVVGSTRPDLTLVLDLPVELGLERARRRSAPDRFETRDLGFHQRLREIFLAIAQGDPGRCLVIDASAGPESVSDAIWAAVQSPVVAEA